VKEREKLLSVLLNIDAFYFIINVNGIYWIENDKSSIIRVIIGKKIINFALKN